MICTYRDHSTHVTPDLRMLFSKQSAYLLTLWRMGWGWGGQIIGISRVLKVDRQIFMESNSAIFLLLLCLLWVNLYRKVVASLGANHFLVQHSKEEVTKVVYLCKNGRETWSVHMYRMTECLVEWLL